MSMDQCVHTHWHAWACTHTHTHSQVPYKTVSWRWTAMSLDQCTHTFMRDHRHTQPLAIQSCVLRVNCNVFGSVHTHTFMRGHRHTQPLAIQSCVFWINCNKQREQSEMSRLDDMNFEGSFKSKSSFGKAYFIRHWIGSVNKPQPNDWWVHVSEDNWKCSEC